MQRALSGMPARRRELEREEDDGVGVGIRDEGRKERKEGRKEEIGSCVHSAVGLFLPQPSKTPRLEAGQRGERDAALWKYSFFKRDYRRRKRTAV